VNLDVVQHHDGRDVGNAIGTDDPDFSVASSTGGRLDQLQAFRRSNDGWRRAKLTQVKPAV
jgi:hypothetical protein